ncbi:hypothetical protein AB1Y20_012566 [Prymnesium parvum]|uniref:C-type lectin domain-containing protein n=1 Tax=Prymnesium parvum TaxID=97485 RepID=A0AB34IJ63_PRYPA
MAWLLVGDQRTWADAQRHCASLGLQLAVLRDEADAVSLRALLRASSAPSFLWIGASDAMREGEWRWVDGGAVQAFDWADGEPMDVGNEDCAALFKHAGWRWVDLGCDSAIASVCSPHSPPLPPLLPSPPLPPPLPPLPPPPPRLPGARTEYVLSTSLRAPDPSAMRWENARAACASRGMELAVVRGAADQATLAARLREEGAGGLLFWIGARRLPSGQFAWSDGAAVEFSAWRDGQPDGSGECVDVHEGGEWRWSDSDCDGPRAFVCSRPLPPGPPAAPPRLTPLVPAGGGNLTFQVDLRRSRPPLPPPSPDAPPLILSPASPPPPPDRCRGRHLCSFTHAVNPTVGMTVAFALGVGLCVGGYVLFKRAKQAQILATSRTHAAASGTAGFHVHRRHLRGSTRASASSAHVV